MIVRFGYVAMSVNVANASPSKTMTATSFCQIGDRDAALRKLGRIAEENLHNTLRLLRHNQAYDIHVFRFSSRLIPLVTHQVTEGWEPFSFLADHFREVGDYVRLHGMRTSLHPDHFTVMTTPRAEVLRISIADLEHQAHMLTAMGLDERAKCNIHIGGTYGDKPAALARFRERFPELKPEVRHRLTLENDDKTYTARETLDFAEEIGVPMVLDIHHHQINPGLDGPPEELWTRIRHTWERNEVDMLSRDPHMQASQPGELLPPKVHSSSPRNEQNRRAHADYVEPEPLFSFLRAIAAETPRLDVMIEAKQKDGALFALMKDLSDLPEVRRIDGATIEIKG
ncbi:MAG: UV DNA damage repair endonuclease UvsE [Gorillibacterium sp.]|nr:UV DNA damage repair endonuclease UvsE [Gorillibacterium sp.]